MVNVGGLKPLVSFMHERGSDVVLTMSRKYRSATSSTLLTILRLCCLRIARWRGSIFGLLESSAKTLRRLLRM